MDQDTEKRTINHAVIPGIGLIVLGSIFLLLNFDVIDFGHRWWALFFLIPISYMLSDIFRKQGAAGESKRSTRGSIIGVVTLGTLMLIFLLGMNWGVVWPVFIIIGGISVILSQRR